MAPSTTREGGAREYYTRYSHEYCFPTPYIWLPTQVLEAPTHTGGKKRCSSPVHRVKDESLGAVQGVRGCAGERRAQRLRPHLPLIPLLPLPLSLHFPPLPHPFSPSTSPPSPVPLPPSSRLLSSRTPCPLPSLLSLSLTPLRPLPS